MPASGPCRLLEMVDTRSADIFLNYRLTRLGTGQGVGWYECLPQGEWRLENGLSYLREHPNDIFMHRHLLRKVGELEPEKIKDFLPEDRAGDPLRTALALEAAPGAGKLEMLRDVLREVDWETLKPFTPLIDISWFRQGRSEGYAYWLSCFARNSLRQEALPEPASAAFPLPYGLPSLLAWKADAVGIEAYRSSSSQGEDPARWTVSKDRCRHLADLLQERGVLQGWESRTEATVSPYAVERPWVFSVRTAVGRNRLKLEGLQTSYGRGFDVHQARISCLMEIVERFSSFAEFAQGRCVGYAAEHELVRGSFETLRAGGMPALDPDTLSLEVSYEGDALYWVTGEHALDGQPEDILVPAQLVFLFPNLDERSLTSGLSSTGLGAGDTPAAAKLSALLEVLERDAEKVVPFRHEDCFLLDAEGSKGAETLSSLARRGITVQFRDMTSEFGVPCYQAFIVGPGGVILKGSAAHMDGARAVLAAMTEVPYPYPYWFGAMPPAPNLPVRRLREMPCYASDDAEADLKILETLLKANGLAPVYVDLTRRDMAIPVYRAMVPGLEMMTVYDRCTPLCLRQFGHYLSRQKAL